MLSGYFAGLGIKDALPTSNHANSPETGFWETGGGRPALEVIIQKGVKPGIMN